MPTTDCGFAGERLLTRFGPTIHVQVGFDHTFRQGQSRLPALPEDVFPALIDTGAGQSCIDNDLATALELPIVDRHTIAGAHGSADVNVYVGQIRVPGLQFTIYGRFSGVALRAGGQPHYALIGRTFLRYFVMHYDGRNGAVTLSND